MAKECLDVKIVRNARRVELANIEKITSKRSNYKRKPSKKWVVVTLTASDIKRLLGGRISGAKILQKRKGDYDVGLYRYINTGNCQSRATAVSKVGKVHGMFRGKKFRSLGEYRKRYLSQYPDAIDNAVEDIMEDFKRFGLPAKKRREYKKHVEFFVENLVINQSYTGLKIQEAILVKMSEIMGQDYRWATDKEDSSGIDGFVGEIPFSVKSKSSNVKKKPGTKRIDYSIDEKNNTLSFTFSL
jgi:hypothetical protein